MTPTANMWHGLAALPRPHLTELFAHDADRMEVLTLDVGGIYFDFTKTHLDGENLALFAELAHSAGFDAKRDLMFSGGLINTTEKRAAEHTAERGEGAAESVAKAKVLHERMRALIEVIDAGGFGDVADVGFGAFGYNEVAKCGPVNWLDDAADRDTFSLE